VAPKAEQVANSKFLVNRMVNFVARRELCWPKLLDNLTKCAFACEFLLPPNCRRCSRLQLKEWGFPTNLDWLFSSSANCIEIDKECAVSPPSFPNLLAEQRRIRGEPPGNTRENASSWKKETQQVHPEYTPRKKCMPYYSRITASRTLQEMGQERKLEKSVPELVSVAARERYWKEGGGEERRRRTKGDGGKERGTPWPGARSCLSLAAFLSWRGLGARTPAFLLSKEERGGVSEGGLGRRQARTWCGSSGPCNVCSVVSSETSCKIELPSAKSRDFSEAENSPT
jgi:hypothetical protein